MAKKNKIILDNGKQAMDPMTRFRKQQKKKQKHKKTKLQTNHKQQTQQNNTEKWKSFKHQLIKLKYDKDYRISKQQKSKNQSFTYKQQDDPIYKQWKRQNELKQQQQIDKVKGIKIPGFKSQNVLWKQNYQIKNLVNIIYQKQFEIKKNYEQQIQIIPDDLKDIIKSKQQLDKILHGKKKLKKQQDLSQKQKINQNLNQLQTQKEFEKQIQKQYEKEIQINQNQEKETPFFKSQILNKIDKGIVTKQQLLSMQQKKKNQTQQKSSAFITPTIIPRKLIKKQ